MSQPLQVLTSEIGDWDALLRDFPSRSVFHTRAWLELLCATHGLRPHLFRVEAGDGGCQALWPFLELRKGPLRVLGSPLPGWGTAYLGPLFRPGTEPGPVCRAVLARPEIRRASYLEARVLTGEPPVSLASLGWRELLQFETYLLSLERTEEELWQGVGSKTRNMVRKATKNGFEVEIETDPSCLDDFFAMSLEVFERWDLRPPFDLRFLRALWDHLAPAGRLRVQSAFLEGERAATVVLLHDDQTMYYWGGGSFDRFRKLSPNNLLLWEAILAARELGLRRFDFVSSSGTAGRFKKSFGPEPVAIATHWGRSRTPVEAWLKRAYERWARRQRRAGGEAMRPDGSPS